MEIIEVYETILATKPEYRKKIGAFYTPKFIVDYMVSITFKKSFENKNYQEISEIKVLDPACGGGAFLIGAYNYLLEYHTKYKQRELSIEERLSILKTNLFGVDIDPEAIKVCQKALLMTCYKTDSFENVDETELLENIKCGDSLISRFSLDANLNSVLIKEYKSIVAKYKNSLGGVAKNQVRERIKNIKNTFIREIEKEKNQEIYRKAFEWRFEFPEVLDENGNFTGFDIIIGNPPYINVETFGANSSFTNYLKNKSSIWMDKSDILFYFIELASKLSRNPISYIVSNAFLFSDKAKLLRNFLLQNCPIYKLINFERFMVFDKASITSMMIFMDKSLSKNYKETDICNFIELNYDKKELLKIISKESNSFKCTFKKDSVFALINSEVDLLNKKIDKNYPKLGELLKVGSGMQSAINEVFCFKEYPKQFPKEFIKKRMSGEIIEKYTHKEHLEYLLYIENAESFKKLPIKIQNHLIQNKEKLENRATVKNEGRIWWRYSRPVHKEFYKFSKIWCSYRAGENEFCLDESNNDFIGLTNTTVIFGNNDEINLKYVLALLNSKLLNFRYKSIGKQTGGGIFEYFENQISQFPIPKISQKEQKPFIDLIEKIIEIKTPPAPLTGVALKNKDTTELENQIDQLVYKLYDLTPEEIKIIKERS